jgi:hypothetical protein
MLGRDCKITLLPTTVAFFHQQSQDKLPKGPLIAHFDGSFWGQDAWKNIFKKAAIVANLPAASTTYALQHSTITDLIVLHILDLMTVAMLSGTSLRMIETLWSFAERPRSEWFGWLSTLTI